LGGKPELNELLRRLPQVDAVLNDGALEQALQQFRHDVVRRVVRGHLNWLRDELAAGRSSEAPSATAAAQHVAEYLRSLCQPRLKRVVNATGVLLHTNLGRAVLPPEALGAAMRAGSGYCNLEFDLQTGERSQRDAACEPLMWALTGCEAATVVNNCAAAVLLVINTLADGKKVITSRGELVEIGGSFRVPDVVRGSGAELEEVGTTNRTRIADYEEVIGEEAGLLLKTHTSNYRVTGFTEEASISELVALGKKHRLPVFVDLGSGYVEPESGGELDEPGLLATLAEGPGLVSFSGDKLLGGPQAGIIVGKREYIDRLRRNPLWRALRIDKLTAGALSATLAMHLHNPEVQQAGMAAMLHDRAEAKLKRLAGKLKSRLAELLPDWRFETRAGSGSYGGGSLPEVEIPSWLLIISPAGATVDQLHARLRDAGTPVVGYPQGGAYVLNMLSLLPGDDKRIIDAFEGLAGE